MYEQVAISVPSDWKVVTNYVCPEPQGPGTLFLGPSKDPEVFCPEYRLDVDSVTVTSVTSVPDAALPPPQVTCAPIIVHGLAVDVEPCSSSDPSGDTTWLVSGLGIEALATQGGGSSVGGGTATVVGKVLHTLRRASAQEVIDSSPLDWPTYTYRGAAISVPSSWAVRREQNCPDTEAEGTLELGIPKVLSDCTAISGTPAEVVVSTPRSGTATAGCPKFRVNGLVAYVPDCSASPPAGLITWVIPTLGIEVSGSGTGSAQSNALVELILHTIRRATPQGIAASAPLSLRITLQHTRVAAGLPIKGTAVFTNRSGDPITVEACAADGWLDVGLANKHISYQPANVAIACAPTVQLATGVTRLPITVATTFEGCAQSASAPEFPTSCPGGPAPLPAGSYYTVVVTSGLPAGTPAPNVIAVTLTHNPSLRG